MLTKVAPIRRFSVGTSTTVAVSRMRMPGPGVSNVLLAGSVSRGTCAKAMGTKECARSGCQAPPGYDNAGKDCSNRNMRAVFDELGLASEQMVVVGTRSDRIGFLDRCTPTVRAGGFRETEQDYAAFFARAGDGVAIATHMADCGFVAVEFGDVFGFIHLTRLNMSLPSSTQLLHYALGYYGAQLAEVRLRLISGITAENFPQRFADVEGSRPEDRFPGWFAKGLLRNRTRPLWLPSDGIDPTDVWEADNRAMMLQQLRDTGVAEHQLESNDVIDPGDLSEGHASHSWGMRGYIDVARDAYVILPTSLTRNSTGVAAKTGAITTTPVELRRDGTWNQAGDGMSASDSARAASSARLRAMPSRPS